MNTSKMDAMKTAYLMEEFNYPRHLEKLRLHETGESDKTSTTLLDLPVELHLRIIGHCLLENPREPEPDDMPLGRHVRREYRQHLCGSVRDLTLVNKYFRELTAPFLFKTICIDDASESTREDKIRNTLDDLLRLPTYEYLQHMKKFTISLGRTPNPHQHHAGLAFIEMLSYMQWPTTMRYVFERISTDYTLLNDVHLHLLRWRRRGFEFLIFKPRQLEFSCPWGGHNHDFQFLTWPYLNIERLWLDYNTEYLQPQSLNLEKMSNLEYVMHRAQPYGMIQSDTEAEKFQGLTALGGRRPPKLRQLCHTMKQVKHLALCGLLKGPITEISPLIRDLQNLEQLDITDQQIVTDNDIYDISEQIFHPSPEIDFAMKHSHLMQKHPDNMDRTEAATVFFTTLPKLQRICFVRDQIGELYHAIRDDETGILERVEKGEMTRERYRFLRYDARNPSVWRCGFPNILGHNKFARLRDFGGWCTTERAFWLDPRYIAGDESVVPYNLRFDVAAETEWGQTIDPEEDSGIAAIFGRMSARLERDRIINSQHQKKVSYVW